MFETLRQHDKKSIKRIMINKREKGEGIRKEEEEKEEDKKISSSSSSCRNPIQGFRHQCSLIKNEIWRKKE